MFHLSYTALDTIFNIAMRKTNFLSKVDYFKAVKKSGNTISFHKNAFTIPSTTTDLTYDVVMDNNNSLVTEQKFHITSTILYFKG